MEKPLAILVEGRLESYAIKKMLSILGIDTTGLAPHVAGSNSLFWQKARKYNRAAGNLRSIFIGLGDQENPNICPPKLIRDKLSEEKNDYFILRIAERMLENWLMADVDSLAQYLGISRDVVRKETVKPGVHPKIIVANLASRSKMKDLRTDIVPEPGAEGPVGGGYTTRMAEYIQRFWDPEEARVNNDSLDRALDALERALSS